MIRRGAKFGAALSMVDSTRMAELVRELAGRADWVLFDVPATSRVADAQRLAVQMDGTLLILDGVYSTISAVRAAAGQIGDAEGNLIGFFYNRCRGNSLASLIRS
jgi:protein-tyrosine kinase